MNWPSVKGALSIAGDRYFAAALHIDFPRLLTDCRPMRYFTKCVPSKDLMGYSLDRRFYEMDMGDAP